MKPVVDILSQNIIIPIIFCVYVVTPLWGKCEVATHTPEK